MDLPQDLLYHPEHTWARIEGSEAVIGITDHAQGELGDIVFVELPEIGRELVAGGPCGSIESSKSVSELFSPVSGEVVVVNQALEDAPEAVNDDPYGAGWIARVKLPSGYVPTGLMGAQRYAAHIGEV